MTDDFYDLLGVGREASREEIRRAYRQQVRRYHPDLNDDPRAPAQFTALKKAYETLGDPKERDAYERLGHDQYVRKRISGLPSPDQWQIPGENGAGGSRGGAGGSADGADSTDGADGDPTSSRSGPSTGSGSGGSTGSRSGGSTGSRSGGSTGSRSGGSSSGSGTGGSRGGSDGGAGSGTDGTTGSADGSRRSDRGSGTGRRSEREGSGAGGGSPGSGTAGSGSSGRTRGSSADATSGDGDASAGRSGGASTPGASGSASSGTGGSRHSGTGRSRTGDPWSGGDSAGTGSAGNGDGQREGEGAEATTGRRSARTGPATGAGTARDPSRANRSGAAAANGSSGTATGPGGGSGTPGGSGATDGDRGRLADRVVVDPDRFLERIKRLGLGWPMIALADVLYLLGLGFYLAANAAGVERLLEATGGGLPAVRAALAAGTGVEPLPAFVRDDFTAGAAVGGALVIAGAAALPSVYTFIIRETRVNRTPWRPSYLYAVGALGPLGGMVADLAVSEPGLYLELACYVVLPVGAIVGLPTSAFLLPRVRRFFRRTWHRFLG